LINDGQDTATQGNGRCQWRRGRRHFWLFRRASGQSAEQQGRRQNEQKNSSAAWKNTVQHGNFSLFHFTVIGIVTGENWRVSVVSLAEKVSNLIIFDNFGIKEDILTSMPSLNLSPRTAKL
jgi:hypothetical protein